ncbi:MAG: SIS domain-containing protein, partial [Firmicutes bacterium]|nr:SIS domain-containing protein [Bacillota bacterium]
VIGISQSGQSLAAVRALEQAKSIGTRTIAVTAGKGSPISKAADQTVLVNCGEERVGPKTKGYSATVMVLIGLAGYLEGHGLDGEIVHRIQSYLDGEDLIKDLVDNNSQTNLCFVIGSDDNFGTAREGALKIMEIAKIPSMYFDVEDSMHGPFTTVTENSFVIVLGIDETAKERMEGLVKILERIGAKGCFISDGRIQSLGGEMDLENLYCDSIADIVPIQLLSYYFALARGVNPIQMSYDRSFVRSITKLVL